MGISAAVLSASAPDLALVVVAAVALLCLPAALRAVARARRSWGGTGDVRRP